MRLVKQISEDEVFSRWFINEAKGRLGEDLESFVQRYPHYRAIVEKPNFESEFENRKRAVLCWLSRGAILFQLPLDVVWYQAEISEDDFKSLFGSNIKNLEAFLVPLASTTPKYLSFKSMEDLVKKE